MLLSLLLYPNIWGGGGGGGEGANSIGGQLRGDKECPFSGVTNSGKVWRKGTGKRGLECDTVANPYQENVHLSYSFYATVMCWILALKERKWIIVNGYEWLYIHLKQHE